MRLRATAKLRETAVMRGQATLQQLTNPNGDARCAITLDPTAADPASSHLPGGGAAGRRDHRAGAGELLRQSEQIESRLWLAADEDAAAGVLLQKLPQEGGGAARPDVDAWQRVGALTRP